MNILNNNMSRLTRPITCVWRQRTAAPHIVNIHRARIWDTVLVWRVWMFQNLHPSLQPQPAARNGWHHSGNLMLRRLYLQYDRGWEYERNQTFLVDDTNDQTLDISLTPARDIRK